VSYLSTRVFWLATAERAVKTFAQALLAALTIAQTAGTLGVDVLNVNWATAVSLAIGAAILSVLTSVSSGPVGPVDSPSLVDTN
jgi:hypothetical protein